MQTIIVDTTPGYRMPTIYYSQGDVGTQFAIDLRSRFGDSLPVVSGVTIQATKPSGFGFSEQSTSFTNGIAVFTTTDEMTDEFGRFPAEAVFYADEVTLFTANFYMEGERNPHPDGTIDGQQETVIPELTQLVERVETAASSVLDMTVEAETLAAGSQATYSYDEDTNTATFGIPQGEAGAGAAGVTASAYSSSKTYAVGDYVIHNSNLYRCTTAITTAESFTAAHWTQVVLGDDVSDLKSAIDSLHKVETYTQTDLKYNVGRAISVADGSYAVNANFACSDFTYLGGIDFIVVTKSGANTEALVAFYDEEFNYISGVSKSTLPQRIVPPSTAKFFRFSARYNEDFEANLYGDTPNDKTTYNNTVLSNSGKYIDYDGSLGTHSAFLYSDMIDISDAEYSFSLLSSGVITGCAIAFYTSPTFDANSFISGREVTNNEVFPINVDVPINANFVAFSGRSGQTLIVEQLRKNAKKAHYGESLSILGDSISTFSGYIGSNLSYYPKEYLDNVNRTWWKQLLDATGMVLNKNNSWSGALMSGDDYTAGRFRCEELDDGTEPDHIIVYMGANDFKEPMGLGSCGLDSQTFSTNNFSDAYYSALSKIKTKYPNAKLYLGTIMQLNYAEDGVEGFPIINSNGVNLIEFNEAIKKLAEIFGCEVIDFASCGNTYFNRANVFGDGRLHPNTTGAYNLFLTAIKHFA